MQARQPEDALCAYERVTCEVNLANLVISLCLHTEPEEYSDGEVMDIVMEVCNFARNEESYKIRDYLAEQDLVKEIR